MIKKYIFTIFCLVSFPFFKEGQAQEKNWNEALVTDRPDTAESSLTVGRLRFQTETSFAFSHDQNSGINTNTYSFPTLFRFGVFKNFEARLESETYAIQTKTGTPKESGFTDIAVGFKIHFFDQKTALPSFGFLAHMNIPTGKSSFSSEVAEPIFKALADWNLPLDFSLGINIGIDVPVRDSRGDKFARFLYAASLGHPLPPLPERWRAFIELAGATPINNNKADEHHFDLGTTFLITPDMQVDTFVQVGLNRNTPDITTGLGFSLRIF